MVSQRRGSSLAAMRALGCLLAALWLLLAAPHVQAQACPSVVVTKARAKTTRTHAIIKMAVSLSKGSPYVNDAAIKISLPQGVSPVVGTRISRSQKGASRTISPYADGLNVYFTGLRLRKSITVVVRAELSGCTLPSTLTFDTLVYQEDALDNVVCPVSGTITAPVKFQTKTKRGCTTASPTLPPSSAPFVAYGVGQRCLQAGQLAPFTRRQLGSSMERSLAETIDNPDQCFSYCGINGDTPAPYFFNWKESTKQCWCCGGVCTLVSDADYTAFVATTQATAAPTAFNTTGSRRRLMAVKEAEEATAATGVRRLTKDEARKISDETFRGALLATQDTNVAALDTTTSQSAVRNVGANVTNNSKVAIVTFLSDASKEAYHPMQDYENIYPLTSASLKKYADRWGYKLIIHREPFEEQKQAYWEKMRIIREAFEEGFEYVLYTDIDVLILDYERPLQDFMVDRDIITVNEWLHGDVYQTPRSGFLLLRNTPRSNEFLDVWAKSYDFYANIENPEQSSLEAIYSAPSWQKDVFLHDWSAFHSYDSAPYGMRSFSMHFPGRLKVYRVAKTWVYLHTLGTHASVADSEEAELTEYAAGLLRDYLAKYSEPATRLGFKPHPEEKGEVEQCLRTAAAAGYTGDQSGYDIDFHAYTELYMVLDALTNIPSRVFLTVPDKAAVPESVQANINSWRDLNPGYDVVVHDDADLEVLVQLLMPELHDIWADLLNVQRADIYRFIVVAFFGGIYADSDTVCMKPVANWTAADIQTGLIVGVEAQNVDTEQRHEGHRTVVLSQYVFAASAFHPVLARMLYRLVDGKAALVAAAAPSLAPAERLSAVLRSTGPTAWTDVVGEYLCYAQSGYVLTPDAFWRGGKAPALEVLPIAAFGAGQTHSGAPSADDADVLAIHKFEGSVAFRGENWMQATE